MSHMSPRPRLKTKVELRELEPLTPCMPYDFDEDPSGSGRVSVVSSPAKMSVSKSLAGSRSVQRMADRTKGDDGMFERARRGTRRLRHPNLEFRRMLVLVTNPLDL